MHTRTRQNVCDCRDAKSWIDLRFDIHAKTYAIFVNSRLACVLSNHMFVYGSMRICVLLGRL